MGITTRSLVFITTFAFLFSVFAIFLSKNSGDVYISKLDPAPLNFSYHRFESSYYPYIDPIDYRGFVYE